MEITEAQFNDLRSIVNYGLRAESPNDYFSMFMLNILDELIKTYKEVSQ